MSKIKTGKYKYPCIDSVPKTRDLKLHYSNIKDGHFGIKKVVVPLSICAGLFVDHEGEYGLTPWAFGIKIKNKKEGEQIKKALTSENFKKVWQAISWSNVEWKMFKYFRKDFYKDFL